MDKTTPSNKDRIAVFIFLLIVFFAILSGLTSCQKCGDCTTYITKKTQGQNDITYSREEYLCGHDYIGAEGTKVTVDSTDGIITTITEVTTCK